MPEGPATPVYKNSRQNKPAGMQGNNRGRFPNLSGRAAYAVPRKYIVLYPAFDAERDALCSGTGQPRAGRRITIHKLYLKFKLRIFDPIVTERNRAASFFVTPGVKSIGVQNAKRL
jgi:hypothetical protein